MRIGILTYHFSDNFGALLQAYALRTWLTQGGFEANFINYHPRYVEEGRFSALPTVQGVRTNTKSLFLQFAKIRSRLSHSGSLAAIDEFRSSSLAVSGTPYRSKHDLEVASPHFDVLLCGSDQIWNVSPQFGIDPVYFLNFDSTATRRISYAASFGASDLPSQYHAEGRSYIDALDAVSVREQRGADFASSLIGRNVECVPDPTFLLDSYKDLIESMPPSSGDNLFFYVLRSSKGFRSIATALSQELQATVLSGYNPLRRWREIGKMVPGGPKEWVAALSRSKFSVSNSFHATAFSLLLNIPFASVRLPGKRARLSERLRGLLQAVNLEDRLIDAGDAQRAIELSRTPIDWELVNNAIQGMRENGRAYLLKSLSE